MWWVKAKWLHIANKELYLTEYQDARGLESIFAKKNLH